MTEPQSPQPTVGMPLAAGLFFAGLGAVWLAGMHLTMPNVGGTGLILPFNAWTWLFFAFPLGVGLYAVARSGGVRMPPGFVLLTVGALCLSLPVVFPQAQPFEAWPRLAGLWAGWLLLLLLVQPGLAGTDKPWLLLPAGAVLIQSGLGFGQFFFLEPGNLFGYWADNWRPVGVFNQPNVAASFYATGLAISGYAVVRWQGRLQPAGPEHAGWIGLQRAVVWLMPLVTLPLIFVLGSRTGWIAAGLVLPGIGVYALKKRLRRPVLLWLLASALGVVLGWAMLAGQPDAGSRAVAKANLESPRWVMYRQAWGLVQERPVLGHGLGRFEPAQVETAARLREENPAYPPVIPSTTHPHNEVLYVWAEGGVVALGGLVLMLIAGGLVVTRLPPGQKVVSVVLILPIVLHTQLELPLYISAIHWLTLVLLLAMILKGVPSGWRRLNMTGSGKPVLKVGSLVLPVALVWFMATTLHSNRVLNDFQRQVYRDLSELEAVSNPWVWRDRADWLRFYSALVIGMNTDTPEYVEAYVTWADDVTERKPRRALLQYQVVALNWLGREDEAADTLERARRWYPDQTFDPGIRPEFQTELSGSAIR